VTKEGLKVLALKDLSAVAAAEGVLSAKQLAVARYADAMTRDVKVSDEVFGQLRVLFNEKEVVEITATVRSSQFIATKSLILSDGTVEADYV